MPPLGADALPPAVMPLPLVPSSQEDTSHPTGVLPASPRLAPLGGDALPSHHCHRGCPLTAFAPAAATAVVVGGTLRSRVFRLNLPRWLALLLGDSTKTQQKASRARKTASGSAPRGSFLSGEAGAGSGTRTRKTFRSVDFKSTASANFAIPAVLHAACHARSHSTGARARSIIRSTGEPHSLKRKQDKPT